MFSTSPGHCAAAGHSSLPCSRSAASGGRGSSRWWGADKPAWSEISSRPPLCSRSWALSGAQTAAGLQEHPHHTHTHTHKHTHARTHTNKRSPEQRQMHVPKWIGTCVWGGDRYTKDGEEQWGDWKKERKDWETVRGGRYEDEDRNTTSKKESRREGKKKQEKCYLYWPRPPAGDSWGVCSCAAVIRHADCGLVTVCDQQHHSQAN